MIEADLARRVAYQNHYLAISRAVSNKVMSNVQIVHEKRCSSHYPVIPYDPVVRTNVVGLKPHSQSISSGPAFLLFLRLSWGSRSRWLYRLYSVTALDFFTFFRLCMSSLCLDSFRLPAKTEKKSPGDHSETTLRQLVAFILRISCLAFQTSSPQAKAPSSFFVLPLPIIRRTR